MKITEVNQVGSFIEVKLIYSKSISIEYLRGQYVNLAVAGAKRSYSICELNNHKKVLTLIISPVLGGVVTEYFATSPIGQKIRVEIPLGSFVYREPNNSNILSAYVCTGSGIVPLMNTFDGGRTLPQNVCVYWGVRKNCEMVSKIHLASTGKIKIFISSSDTFHTHETGRLRWESIDQRESIENWYLVGNPQMIDDFSRLCY